MIATLEPGALGGKQAAADASTMVDVDRIIEGYRAVRADLLDQRDPLGHWIGELSSSALSTATAISALALVRRHAPHVVHEAAGGGRRGEERVSRLILEGVQWLAAAQNEDGGWGDTDRSLSNIATTMLVRAAFRLTCVPADPPDVWEGSDEYVRDMGGLPALRRRYGRDKTFVVPILTNCALAGMVPWSEVSALPFELACLPHGFYRFVRLPVVSYAIPALVAIGQAKYFHDKPWNPVTRGLRSLAAAPSLRVLERMQPESGGYLEATPLTSFVVMSLASVGQGEHAVVRRGVDFLLDSVREDGSWPIDTNLATWNTTLALNALAAGGEEAAAESSRASVTGSTAATPGLGGLGSRCAAWVLSCQHRLVHPFTAAAPGGWGWSDLSGAVPDADDTSSALLALKAVAAQTRDAALIESIAEAAGPGIDWLLGLQNRDGGWPTFCRGWGTLPFDRSGADLTAHAIRALAAWKRGDEDEGGVQRFGSRSAILPMLASPAGRFPAPRMHAAIDRGFAYLARGQRADGSWAPLWFGNQYHPDEENLVYGTAKVLFAYRDLGGIDTEPARRGLSWLVEHQNVDGGWGGARDAAEEDLDQPTAAPPRSSVEETALAVEALLASDRPESTAACQAGLDWLLAAIESKTHATSSPIGFYFAKLWYYEKLYPLIFTVSALGRAARRQMPTRHASDRSDRSPEMQATAVDRSPS
jgi:squalene-hopene/tetraprenyl-beta-curcumene cyclase